MSGLFGKRPQPPKPPTPSPSDPVPSILQDLQSVGFQPGVSLATFRERIQADEVLQDVLQDPALESWYARHLILAKLDGLVHDWRFDTAEVLEEVALRLEGASIKLSWIEDEQQARAVRLRLDSTSLDWRFSSVQGLLYGVNELLQRAGQPWRFLGLESGGDEYFFALCSPDQATALRTSPLFKEWCEKDDEAREGA